MLSQILLAVLAAYLILLVSWHLLRRYLIAKHTGLVDLPFLKSCHPDKKIPGTAVICGGSIAGLLPARVCHDHFEHVLVVEPEAWKLPRSRVVQYTSLHAFQSYLFAGLKSLFPNIEDECRLSTIRVLPSNARFNISGVLLQIPFSSYKSKLPKTIRLVISACPHMELTTGTVTDIIPDLADHSRLSTVVVRTASGLQEFTAALVADCTGPVRAGMKWLGRHRYGYSDSYPAGKLPLDQLNVSFDQKLRYSSMMFCIDQFWLGRLSLPPDIKNDGPMYTFIEDGVEQGRVLFALMRPDGDTFLAFVGQHENSRSPPKNLAELKAFVEGLNAVQRIPDWVFEILDMLKEVNDSVARLDLKKIEPAPTSYVRYHRATYLPSNWVALGDSVMTCCTKAFKGALSLHNVLRAASGNNVLPSKFSTTFFAEHFDKTDLMWQNTRLMDYGVPTTEPIPSESLSSGAYLRWYISQLQHLALTMPPLSCTVGFGSPIDAFNPNIVMKILWRTFFG
ncbi:hypothetical protein C8J57DRAFT_1277510 [Mycena rebaudengoi]|nr:hypothetical protein C8J57DRAFT_1277510 [Mycena rebaudengoi]